MLYFYIFVAIGGALGACTRLCINNYVGTLYNNFPLSTFIVNILGCLLIGFVIHYFSHKSTVPLFLQAGITVGFLGGLTTFSAFALEILLLLEKKQWYIGASYLVLSNLFCVVAVYLGITIGRKLY